VTGTYVALTALALIAAPAFAEVQQGGETFDVVTQCAARELGEADQVRIATMLVDAQPPSAAPDVSQVLGRVAGTCSQSTGVSAEAGGMGLLHVVLRQARGIVFDRLSLSPEQRTAMEATLLPIANELELRGGAMSGPRLTDDQLARARTALSAAGFGMEISTAWLRGVIQSLSSERLLRPRMDELMAGQR
jgi:hypothetical protein